MTSPQNNLSDNGSVRSIDMNMIDMTNLVPRVSLLPVKEGKKRDPGNEVET